MAGIAQNRQRHLIFIVVLPVRTKMREKVKGGKKTREWVRQCKHTNIYPYLYIHTLTDTQTYINTDTHMHNNTSFITQVR